MACFNKKNSGQSLIEVIVAVGMMALLLTAVLALISLSVKNSRLAKDRTKAVGLVQEGIELMRTYRDKNWIALYTATGNTCGLNKTWTVEEDLIDSCDSCDSLAENNSIDDFFRRCVQVDADGGNQVNIQVVVSWQEGAQAQQTIQTTNLSLWER